MIKVLLVPVNFGDLYGDPSFDDQNLGAYIQDTNLVLGIPVNLPAVPRIGDIVSLDYIPEEELSNLIWSAFLEGKKPAIGIVRTYRDQNKDLCDKAIILNICKKAYPETAYSFYFGWWEVEMVTWIANSDTVFVCIKHNI